MIELRSPSLSKIQQKPDHPVWWFTIVTFCKYMPLTFKLSKRAELREEGGVQHYRMNKFPFFPVFFFPIFFL